MGLLTLFKLTLSPQAAFRCICLKFTCPIPNSAWCSHFPLWPWMGTAHSIWQTRDHTFLFFFCFSGPTKITRAFRTVLSSHGTALLCWPSWRCREVSHRSRAKKKKKENAVCDWGGDSVVLAMQTGSPRRQLFIFFFKTVFMAARGEAARRAPTRWFVFQPVWCCLDISCCSNTGGCGWCW